MTRPYDSTRRAARAEASRQAVIDAARTLFAKRGIDRVTIAEVAEAAGVGVSSVYAVFLSKGGLLRALMQDALFGPRYREALARLEGETDSVALVLRTAEVARAVYEGEDTSLGLVRGASAFAPELRTVEAEFEELRFAMQADRVRGLAAAGRLAAGLSVEDARRILWTLTHRELYHGLVIVARWSPARYERWLAATIEAQLVAPRRSGTRAARGTATPATRRGARPGRSRP